MDFCQDLAKNYYQKKLEKLKQGVKVLDLSMINPDFDPPRAALDKLVEFTLKPNYSRYAVAKGIRPLREAFCNKYQSFKVELDAEKNVCVTSGSKNAFLSILLSLANSNDEILLPLPNYPAFFNSAKVANLKISYYQITDCEEKILDNIILALKKTKIRFLVLNFPNNPTGKTVKEDFYKNLILRIDDEIDNKDLVIVNDFAYGEMEYDREFSTSLFSAKSDKTNLLEIYTLSKAYSVPGWRIASIVGDEKLIKKIAEYKSLVDYGTYLPLQMAGAYLLNSNNKYPTGYKNLYLERARTLSRSLYEIGFECSTIKAGCCIWTKLPDYYDLNAYDFCLKLLEDYGIAIQFGDVYGDIKSRFLRIALIVNEAELYRLINAIKELCKR
mgnify:CR=1 FL=1